MSRYILFASSSLNAIKMSRYLRTTVRFSSCISRTNDIMYKNPFLCLGDYLEIPVFTEAELLFRPTLKSMQIAQNLFVPKVGHEIKFITATIDPLKFPQHDLPEVVFIGRSNVGKSSVLKSIFENVPGLIIKTSKKP
ncbi:GTP-binding protein 8-like, partial [Stegodyphus dumicola]|uniref:GTP-binding protein 8-like n=1 Tax=Stegodyphus dumicola TaxID=202533 RepID=UPI0015ABC057